MNNEELYRELHVLRDGIKSEVKSDIQAMQDHLNEMSVKGKHTGFSTKGDPIAGLIKKNFSQISGAGRGKIKLEEKNMTLGTALTGDEPRIYQNQVAMLPSQLVNVADLCQSIMISGGTYTYPREGTPTGAFGIQTEGELKSQVEYNFEMIDCSTDFVAGFAVYSKKMASNLPYLESFLPNALRRDYWKAENLAFNTILVADATPSTETSSTQNQIEMIIADMSNLEQIDYIPTIAVVRPADWYKIMVTEKSDGAGYGLPGVVTYENGVLRINGMMIVKANWIAADHYFVGDWTSVKKVITQGLGVEFSESDGDNFQRNNITARCEAQVNLALEKPSSMIYGDFLAVTP